MLTEAEGIDTDVIGEDRFLDHIADDARMGKRLAIGAGGDVAERVQSEFESLGQAAMPSAFKSGPRSFS